MALFDPKKNQIAQLQRSIEDKNRQISTYYDEIGKLYYRQYRDMNADVSREINTRCERVSALYVEIEECRLRILYERGFKECKNCKKENLLEHAYCSACGEKFPQSNDVSVVTSVDPSSFVVVVPEVSRIPQQAESYQAPSEPVAQDPNIPQQIESADEKDVDEPQEQPASD